MKRILIVLAFLLVPALASAQETYSLAATAGQVARIDRGRTRQNTVTCLARNAVGGATCTQAQACVAYGAAGGAGCSQAQARAASCEIFAATLAGREAFVFSTVANHVQEFQVQATAEDRVSFCVWWNTVASAGAKNAICTTSVPSLGNGCEICP